MKSMSWMMLACALGGCGPAVGLDAALMDHTTEVTDAANDRLCAVRVTTISEPLLVSELQVWLTSTSGTTVMAFEVADTNENRIGCGRDGHGDRASAQCCWRRTARNGVQHRARARPGLQPRELALGGRLDGSVAEG